LVMGVCKVSVLKCKVSVLKRGLEMTGSLPKPEVRSVAVGVGDGWLPGVAM
jgi:hypothetical protein